MAIASAVGVLSQLLSIGLALWATPRFVSALGDTAYGLLAIIGSFTAYFAYLELGIGAAYLRALAVALGRDDHARAQELVETAHFIYCAVAVVGAVGMVATGVPYLASIAGPHERVSVLLGLGCTVVTFAGSMALSTTRGVVIAAQRSDLYARAGLIAQPLIPLLQVASLRLGGGLATLLAIQGAGSLTVDVAMLVVARRVAPALVLRARYHRDVWRELRGFSLFRFVAQLAQQGQQSGDRILLGALLPVATLAPYTIAASIAQRARVLGAVLLAPFFAAAAEAFGRGGPRQLATVTLAFGRRVAVLLALGSAVGSFVARPFLASWVGASYALHGEPVFDALIVATSLLVIAAMLGQATDAAGAPRVSAVGATVGLVLSIGASIPLVHRLGPVGAAYGFLAGGVVQLGWVAAALVALVGPREGASLVTRLLVGPTLLGASAFVVMRLVPHGEGLLARAPAAALGALTGLAVGVATGVVRRDDLPARFRARVDAARARGAA